jgi:hypothetical protein
LGGLAFPPHGIPIAFVQLVPKFDGKDANAYEATRYPIAFHRAGLIAMKMIQESGLERVIATADVKNSTALRWLNRLGFTASTDQEIKGKVLFIWNRKRPHRKHSVRPAGSGGQAASLVALGFQFHGRSWSIR